MTREPGRVDEILALIDEALSGYETQRAGDDWYDPDAAAPCACDHQRAVPVKQVARLVRAANRTAVYPPGVKVRFLRATRTSLINNPDDHPSDYVYVDGVCVEVSVTGTAPNEPGHTETHTVVESLVAGIEDPWQVVLHYPDLRKVDAARYPSAIDEAGQ